MCDFYRHDIAEVAGLVAISFGLEGYDRYIMVYKKDHPPSEDELTARRNGEEWNSETANEYKRKRTQQQEDEKLDRQPKEEVQPTSSYHDKFVHLIGRESAVEAARKTVSNTSYGFVPSENKRDLRSIEQTMADIQAKKRLKTSHPGVDDA